MTVKLSSIYRNVLLIRHLQAIETPGQRLSDLAAHAPLDMSVAVRAAARIRKVHLEGLTIPVVGHSQLLRAKQTAALLLPGQVLTEMPALSPTDFADPDGIWKVYDQIGSHSVKAILGVAPNLLRSEGTKVAEQVKAVAMRNVHDGGVALLCTHGPLIDAAVAVLRGSWDWDEAEFGRGDMIHLMFKLAYDSAMRLQLTLEASNILRAPSGINMLV